MSDYIPSLKELCAKMPQGEIMEGAPRTIETMYRIEKPKAMDLIDWEIVFKFLPRRCHVLLVAPDHGPGDYTHYSVQGADQFFGFANTLATVQYLRDANANRVNVENELKEFNPRLVVHMDHGSANALYGEGVANAPQVVIDTTNSDLLKWRILSTVSCLSASGLGPDAVGKGCSSYIGYNDLHWIITTTHNAFWNCANMVHRMLVLGYSTQVAYDAAVRTYTQNIADFSAMGDMLTATHLQIDLDRLRLIGSTKATACNFKWILPQLKNYILINKVPPSIWPLEVLELMEKERVTPTE
jgi:hypothetical protein